MGDLPQIAEAVQIPLVLPTPAGMMDHRFERSPVLPATVGMEALAQAARQTFPQLPVDCATDARFDRFVYLDSQAGRCEAIADLRRMGNGSVRAALLTRYQPPKAAFARTRAHIRLQFEPAASTPDYPPLDVVASLTGIGKSVSPEDMYRDLVPFGPTFQNIVSPLKISPDGAIGRIRAPRPTTAGAMSCGLLGSAFVLDAAFHAACVWGQHYHDIVAFPVSIDRRTIRRPTVPGGDYVARIFPKTAGGDDTLCFDILVVAPDGTVCESAEGVRMRDVSGGRRRPPAWIRQASDSAPLESLKKACRAVVIVELDAVADFAEQCLTSLEKRRCQPMGARRRRSFLAARLALKRLYRNCEPEKTAALPADRIETVSVDGPTPCIAPLGSPAQIACSVSHDRRFAIAVAGSRSLGVDVEGISSRALRCCDIFMNELEIARMRASALDDRTAAVLAWSIKEAAAKCLGMHLADAWVRVEVTAIGNRQSHFAVDGKPMTAYHATVEGHVLTLVCNAADP